MSNTFRVIVASSSIHINKKFAQPTPQAVTETFRSLPKVKELKNVEGVVVGEMRDPELVEEKNGHVTILADIVLNGIGMQMGLMTSSIAKNISIGIEKAETSEIPDAG